MPIVNRKKGLLATLVGFAHEIRLSRRLSWWCVHRLALPRSCKKIRELPTFLHLHVYTLHVADGSVQNARNLASIPNAENTQRKGEHHHYAIYHLGSPMPLESCQPEIEPQALRVIAC
jgi:hypothetical protein